MSDLVDRLRALPWHEPAIAEAADEIERLRADCKDKQRLIETQKKYLANKDSVIKGLNGMVKKLEGDLEVMRLQRDATQSSRCPNCERLRAALRKIANQSGACGLGCDEIARAALQDKDDEKV